MIVQLVDSDWTANILAGSHFRAQESRAMSPDGVALFNMSLAEHETNTCTGSVKA